MTAGSSMGGDGPLSQVKGWFSILVPSNGESASAWTSSGSKEYLSTLLKRVPARTKSRRKCP
jgi:hypothetical protein